MYRDTSFPEFVVMPEFHAPPPLALDHWLIQESEELADASTVHLVVNLIHAYRTAVAEYLAHRDPEFREIALEAEQALRVELVQLRRRKAAFTVRWE